MHVDNDRLVGRKQGTVHAVLSNALLECWSLKPYTNS